MNSFIDFSMKNDIHMSKRITAPTPLQKWALQQGGWKTPNLTDQPIPTKPIKENEPPRFIVPLYPSSKGDGKAKKPIKVIKVIKRAQTDEDMNIDMNEQDSTGKGGIQPTDEQTGG